MSDYATPARIAIALRQAGANVEKPVLDFGCGTGVSGMALKSVGFDVVDGTDLVAENVEAAQASGAYRQVWLGVESRAGHVRRGDYQVITACDVIHGGEATPETFDVLLGILAPGGFLALSMDDAALNDRTYSDRLDIAALDPKLEQMFEADGPHRDGENATVFVFKRH
ncbi:MAG: methyltransferase domain-containing protein [Silicimonas sp.]|nr:methyltransferase domain-containing protein [Silicimonas sp.]